MKKCSKCKIEKEAKEFYKDKKTKDGLRSYCKQCSTKICKKYQQKNKDIISLIDKRYYQNNTNLILKRNKKYRQNNANKIRIQRKKYRKNQYKINLNFRIRTNLRHRLREALKGKYKNGSAVRDLGCSIEKFVLWIEMHWKEGMTWDNYGDWHLDHKIPLSKFDLTQREQLLRACHFSNIQPLWAEENLSKGDKI